MRKVFKTISGNEIPLPVFFPDATRGVIRTLDSIDIKNTKTNGLLVNTYHLYREVGGSLIKKFDGIRNFMNFEGGVISDSGGFQVMSIAKSPGSGGKITDEGVTFKFNNKKILLTPEKSIEFQFLLKTDMVVVLDDFTEPRASYEKAQETVTRTIEWAKRSKEQYEKECKKRNLTEKNRPYLLGVVQGGDYLDLRASCAKELTKIGFDGFGYGGWPMMEDGSFNYEVAKVIADNTPKDYFLYGLGVGKPHEIVNLVKMGYNIFDCVLPTRDARHKRLYVFNADSIDNINLDDEKFYSYFVPDKEKNYKDKGHVSLGVRLPALQNYSRAYLAHLWRIKELTALRLSTIHNLRFYSILMEKLEKKYQKMV